MPHVSTDQIATWPSLTIPAAHSLDSLNHIPALHHQSSNRLSDQKDTELPSTCLSLSAWSYTSYIQLGRTA